MKKPRKPEVVEVRFRLLTDVPNEDVRRYAESYAIIIAHNLSAKLVRKPTVERIGKR